MDYKIYPTKTHYFTLLPTLLDALYVVKGFLLINRKIINEVKDLHDDSAQHHKINNQIN